MVVRSDITTKVSQRLGDAAHSVFPLVELNIYIDSAIKSLYPTWFKWEVGTTVAIDGAMQTPPTTAVNLWKIAIQKLGTTRPRLVRQWSEGTANAYIPRSPAAGDTIIWSWTQGFLSPADDTTPLDLGPECEEVVIIRCCISALERVVSSRVETAKYFALTVREGVTETDLVNTIDALHASFDTRVKAAVPRPVRVG